MIHKTLSSKNAIRSYVPPPLIPEQLSQGFACLSAGTVLSNDPARPRLRTGPDPRAAGGQRELREGRRTAEGAKGLQEGKRTAARGCSRVEGSEGGLQEDRGAEGGQRGLQEDRGG